MELVDDTPHCSVKVSPIAGHGLFADITFQKGDVVCDHSELWVQLPYKELTMNDWLTCNFIGKNKDVALQSAPRKFLKANHSRSPNCHWDTKAMQLIAPHDPRFGSGGGLNKDYVRLIFTDNTYFEFPNV